MPHKYCMKCSVDNYWTVNGVLWDNIYCFTELSQDGSLFQTYCLLSSENGFIFALAIFLFDKLFIEIVVLGVMMKNGCSNLVCYLK